MKNKNKKIDTDSRSEKDGSNTFPSQGKVGGGSDNNQITREELEVKCEEYLAGWKRALADYENMNRDTAKQLVEGRYRIKESLAHELLPVVDNFHKAVQHAPPADADEKTIATWLQGVTFIAKQFEEVMLSLGIEKIATIGEQFDPNVHEAAGTRSESDKKDQEILEEISTGWRMGDAVIRPASVVINEIN